MKWIAFLVVAALSGCLIPGPSDELSPMIQRVIDARTEEATGISYMKWDDRPVELAVDEGYRFLLNETGVWCKANQPPPPKDAVYEWTICTLASESGTYAWIGGETLPNKPLLPGLPDITEDWHILAIRYVWMDENEYPTSENMHFGAAPQSVVLANIEQAVPGLLSPRLQIENGDLCDGTGTITFRIIAPQNQYEGTIDFGFSEPSQTTHGELDGHRLHFQGNGTNEEMKVHVEGSGNLANPAPGIDCAEPYEAQRWSATIESRRVSGNADLEPVPVRLL